MAQQKQLLRLVVGYCNILNVCDICLANIAVRGHKTMYALWSGVKLEQNQV